MYDNYGDEIDGDEDKNDGMNALVRRKWLCAYNDRDLEPAIPDRLQ